MDIIIREYTGDDVEEAAVIWNHIAEEGIAPPQTNCLTKESADAFFSEQSFTGIAFGRHSGTMMGLYILCPNNMGRCGHICNASYAVKWGMRGRQIGERLIRHYTEKGRELDFSILQFNAMVRTSEAAPHLCQKLGFMWLGVAPRGFLIKDGRYEDIIPYYIVLQ